MIIKSSDSKQTANWMLEPCKQTEVVREETRGVKSVYKVVFLVTVLWKGPFWVGVSFASRRNVARLKRY